MGELMKGLYDVLIIIIVSIIGITIGFFGYVTAKIKKFSKSKLHFDEEVQKELNKLIEKGALWRD